MTHPYDMTDEQLYSLHLFKELNGKDIRRQRYNGARACGVPPSWCLTIRDWSEAHFIDWVTLFAHDTVT